MIRMVWKKPCFRAELGEFQRVSQHFGISIWKLYWFFLTGKLVDLTDNVWSAMDNTDSWDTTTLELARLYADQVGRDADKLLSALPNGQLPAPIILRQPDGGYHKVAGNTRLMVCRALGIRPVVLMIG